MARSWRTRSRSPRSKSPRSKKGILRLGIDLGTGKLCVVGQHVPAGTVVIDGESRLLHFKDKHRGTGVKQIAIYHEDGTITYGRSAIKKLLDDYRHKPEYHEILHKVMESWKLFAHPHFKDYEEVIHIGELLHALKDDAAYQDFLTDFFKAMFQDIRNLYKAPNFNEGRDDAYWDEIQLELQISVPVMWGDKQYGTILRAVQEAEKDKIDKPRVELRSEPLCGATIIMFDLVKNRCIKEGQSVLNMDCGKGTFDIASILLMRIATQYREMQLQQVEKCSGGPFGSHFLNDLFWKWVLRGNCQEIERDGSVEQVCALLGITRRELHRQLSDKFDIIKTEIDESRDQSFNICVKSSHGTTRPGLMHQLLIDLPRNDIMAWYDTWIGEAKKLLATHLSRPRGKIDYACAAFTGAGTGSDLFRAGMEDVLRDHGIPIAAHESDASHCAQGTLKQHYFKKDVLPPRAYFYIARTEIYDPKIHTEAQSVSGRIQKSVYNSRVEVVHDRFIQMTSYSKLGFKSEGLLPMRFYVEADVELPRLHVDLYQSEKPLSEPNTLRDDAGRLRNGVRPFPDFHDDHGDFEKDGFKKRKSKGNKPHYIVNGFVGVDGTDESLSATIYLMKARYEYPEICTPADGQPPAKPLPNDLGQLFSEEDLLKPPFKREVWNSNADHWVSESSGVEGPRSKMDARKAEAERQSDQNDGDSEDSMMVDA